MTTSVVQVRVDTSLKNQAQAIFDALGLDLSSAIRMFLKKSVVERGIPFETTLKNTKNTSLEEGRKAFYALREEAKKNGLQDMTLDEINAEIQAYREGR